MVTSRDMPDDPFAEDEDDLTPEQIKELRDGFPSSTPTPDVALLTEIKDLLAEQAKYLRVLCADAERRNWPMVFVPGGEPGEDGQPFHHFRDLVSQRSAELAARQAEIDSVRD